MKKHIITGLAILTFASVASANRGPTTRPTNTNKQAPIVAATVDSNRIPKSTPRTPHALSGHKSAGFVAGQSNSKARSAKRTQQPRHHGQRIR